MKLGFEESQTSYTSGAQNARVWTEAWVNAWGYCLHCGNPDISKFANNRPLADFHCPACKEEYELKSKKGKFGPTVADGAYKTKCERIAANNNPNLLLMNYDLKSFSVVNLFIVPRHFFVRDIVQERKPLASTARRAGWIGSNILLSRVPEVGKIHIVQNGVVRPKSIVLSEWQKTLFLRQETLEARGWLLDVLKCVESLRKREFTLEDVYSFEKHLSQLYPSNQNVRPKNPSAAAVFERSRTSGICDTRKLSASYLRFQWPGSTITMNALSAIVGGRMNGLVCAMISVRIAEHETSRPLKATI